jgi:hypothetical protein
VLTVGMMGPTLTTPVVLVVSAYPTRAIAKIAIAELKKYFGFMTHLFRI